MHPVSPLQELTCYMGSHSVTCHPAEVTFPPLPPANLVLDSATISPWGCKAELTQLAGYISRWRTHLKTVTHPSTNRARRRVTSLMRPTTLPLRHAASHQSINRLIYRDSSVHHNVTIHILDKAVTKQQQNCPPKLIIQLHQRRI